ncbi:hypothetical protein BD413DRAFT_492173 [Trametes elegans]|nr:hypothetical protein BD413DRAFT_492173 [Trametes elegans]
MGSLETLFLAVLSVAIRMPILAPTALPAEPPVRTFLKELFKAHNDRLFDRTGCPASPLPWSAKSKMDIKLHKSYFPDLVRSVSPADTAALATRFSAWEGVPTLIPLPQMKWLRLGIHDGYPLSLRLGEYTRIRRSFGASRVEEAALWQSTMTFGLLEALTCIPIPESLLISTTDDGTHIFSGDALSSLVVEWLTRLRSVKNRSPQLAEVWMAHIVLTFYRVRDILLEASFTADGPQHDLLPASEAVSIRRTVATLFDTLVHCECLEVDWGQRMKRAGITAVDPMSYVRSLGTSAYFNELIAAGWCPFTLGRSPIFLPHLAFLATRVPHIRSNAREHRDCTVQRCQLYTIDSDLYSPKHTTPDCTCAPLHPSRDSVYAILERGEIPVVALEGHRLVVRGASEGPYVAMSHVWADGLGSVTEDGLPACQVQRIASLTGQLVSGGTFWMDSLCVPQRRDLRKRAIILMAKTYREAHTVLVLDAGISACAPEMPPLERLIRIRMSGWMHRMWTLQEGMLARRLVFQMSQALVDLASLSSGVKEDMDCLPVEVPPYATGLESFMNYMGRGSELAPDLEIILGHLQGRLTTKAEDETIVISGTLGLDTSELVSHASHEERVRVFLLALRHIPSSFVFANSPKLPFHGFRWAPRSFADPSERMLGSGETFICTKAGLEGQFTLIRLLDANGEAAEETFGKAHPLWFRMPGDANDTLFRLDTAGEHQPEFPTSPFNAIVLREPGLPSSAGQGDPCAVVLAHVLPSEQVGEETISCDFVLPADVTKFVSTSVLDHRQIIRTYGALVRSPVLLT